MSKREADEAWAFHRALAGETKPHYEASRVDATTWMVRRWRTHRHVKSCWAVRFTEAGRRTHYLICNQVAASSCLPFKDEALLRDMPADTTEEQAIQVAVERGSWA